MVLRSLRGRAADFESCSISSSLKTSVPLSIQATAKRTKESKTSQAKINLTSFSWSHNQMLGQNPSKCSLSTEPKLSQTQVKTQPGQLEPLKGRETSLPRQPPHLNAKRSPYFPKAILTVYIYNYMILYMYCIYIYISASCSNAVSLGFHCHLFGLNGF